MLKSALFISALLGLLISPAGAINPVSETDTLWIDTISAHSGQKVILGVYFSNAEKITGIDAPLAYFYPDLIVDSVSFAGSRAEGRLTTLGIIDSALAQVHIGALEFTLDDTYIDSGRGLLARLFVTIPDGYPQRMIYFDTTTVNTELTFVLYTNEWFTPNFNRGHINNTFAPALNDSIWFDNVETRAGENFEVTVYGLTEIGLSKIVLPFTYTSDNLFIDSISIADTRSQNAANLSTLIDNNLKQALLSIDFFDTQLLPPGTGPLAKIYFSCVTTGTTPFVVLDTMMASDLEMLVHLGPIYDYVKAYPAFSTGSIIIDMTTDINNESTTALPGTLYLAQNYPNPFNPTTTFRFGLPQQSKVYLEVFNILGQRIRILHSGIMPAGEQEIVFDGKNDQGHAISSGIYFYRLKADDKTLIRKMLLVK
ncbi:MAG: T9SS type A sorting domain-containing protein [candidate division Zixibacteria bacterium]